MGLKLGNIKQAALEVIKEEKQNSLLGRELTRVLGPTILTNHGSTLMAESANNRLDVLQSTDRGFDKINTSLLLKYADSPIAEVRRLVARLLPENFLNRFIKDKNRRVRLAAARRLPVHIVETMVKNHPGDDELDTIFRQKLDEASEEYFGLGNKGESFGEIQRGLESAELDDHWYDKTAQKIVDCYGWSIENPWEEKAVAQLVNGMKSQGVEVDAEKLLDLVYNLLNTRSENSLKEGSLAGISRMLNEQADLETAVMPILPENVDEVEGLLESRCSPVEYISKFEDLFSVKKASIDNPGQRVGINESFSRVKCPASAVVPGNFVGRTEEKALDLYVKHWNSMQSLKGRPYVLSWHPSLGNKVKFGLGVR